jgi:cytolysin-activating lysine-acyltransferase
MNNQPHNEQNLIAARAELAKLPLLGPVMWLYARDPQRRFTFVADLDWRLLPPLVLNQCHVFTKQELPWAFFSWATVSPEVDKRLRSSAPVIAPHEWRSGSIPWLVDVLMPFGEEPELVKQAIAQFAPGQTVSAWVTDSQGQPQLRTYSA